MMQIEVALKILPASKAAASNTRLEGQCPIALAGVQSDYAQYRRTPPE